MHGTTYAKSNFNKITLFWTCDPFGYCPIFARVAGFQKPSYFIAHQ